jgi:hypothetical protein
MKMINNEKGVALITSLMFTLIALSITSMLLYIIMQNVVLSGSHKRYKNTLEASYGAAEIATKEIIPLIFSDYSTAGAFSGNKASMISKLSSISLSTMSSDACLMQKINKPSSLWTGCSAVQMSSAISTVKPNADIFFNLRGAQDTSGFNVYTKIIDTMPGNTDSGATKIVSSSDSTAVKSMSGGGDASSPSLLGGGGVAYNPKGSGGVNVQHIPVRYRIEIQSERAQNAVEKTNLSVLYAY